jgi:hypothetical protein
MDDRIEVLVDLEKNCLEKQKSILKWVRFFGILTIIALAGGVITGLVFLIDEL